MTKWSNSAGYAIVLIIVAVVARLWSNEPDRHDAPVVMRYTAEDSMVNARAIADMRQNGYKVKAEEDTMMSVVYVGKIMTQKAIRSVAAEPNSVIFLAKTAEQYYPRMGTYVAKWRIRYKDGMGEVTDAFGVATVRNNGGKLIDVNNWEVVSARIFSL